MEWIRVQDKMPEDLEEIMFYDGKCIFKGHCSISSIDQWCCWISNGGSSVYDVSHWMHLPLPPKE